MVKIKKAAKILFILLLLVTGFVLTCNLAVMFAAMGRIHSTEELAASDHQVALVLGTSQWTVWGTQNLFFKGRIKAAHRLYDQGVVKHLLLSGDNSIKEYNEPRAMQKALKDEGVEPAHMTMDFAGFRTLDSVIRARKVFGQDSVVIVTQAFHLPRALFIARMNGVHAVGYVAHGPTVSRILVREVLARTAAVIDVLIRRQPKFLGEEEPIRVN